MRYQTFQIFHGLNFKTYAGIITPHSVSQPSNQIIQNVTGAETARVSSTLRVSRGLVALRSKVAFMFASPSFLIEGHLKP
jgi:hypothetical protein